MFLAASPAHGARVQAQSRIPERGLRRRLQSTRRKIRTPTTRTWATTRTRAAASRAPSSRIPICALRRSLSRFVAPICRALAVLVSNPTRAIPVVARSWVLRRYACPSAKQPCPLAHGVLGVSGARIAYSRPRMRGGPRRRPALPSRTRTSRCVCGEICELMPCEQFSIPSLFMITREQSPFSPITYIQERPSCPTCPGRDAWSPALSRTEAHASRRPCPCWSAHRPRCRRHRVGTHLGVSLAKILLLEPPMPASTVLSVGTMVAALTV